MAGPSPALVAHADKRRVEQEELEASSAPDPAILEAMDQAAAEIDAERTQHVQAQNKDASVFSKVLDTVDALGGGAARAIYEAKDFVVGEPNYEDKSAFRREDEAYIADMNRRSRVNAVATGIGQFVTGLAATPSGKAAAVSTAGKTAYEIGRGALIGATLFDPQEERLSNLIESFPSLHNPVSDYLKASPDDSNAEGRFKNALEGIGMDLALVGIFALGLKAVRLSKSDPKQAAKLVQEADRQLQEFNLKSGATSTSQSPENALRPAVATEQPQVPPSSAAVSPGTSTPSPSLPTGRRVPGAEPKVTAGPAEPPPAMAGDGVVPGSMRDKYARGPQAPAEAAQGAPAPELPPQRLGPEGQPTAPAESAAGATVRQGGAASEDLKPAALRKPKDLPDTTVENLVGLADTSRRIGEYGNPQEFRGVSPGGYINWTKVGGAVEVQAYTQAVARAIEPRLRKIAGDVVSDRNVAAMVQARAAAFDEDPAAVVAMIRQQGKNAKAMVADMEAGYATASGIMSDVHRLATKIKLGMLDDFGGDREAAKSELMRQVGIGAEVLASARSMTANAGRSLRRMRKDFKVTPELVSKFEGNTDALVEAIYHSKGDPKLLAKTLNPSAWQRFEDVFSHLITNGPLWYYPTHVINGIGNAYLLAARPSERVLGSLFMGADGKAVRRQALKEYRATVAAAHDGWDAAMQAFMKGDSILAPHQGIVADAGIQSNSIPWVPVNDVADLAHNALLLANWRTATGLPTRFLGMVDEGIKTIRYRSVVQAKAAADAEDLGLSGSAAESFISQRLSDAFDDLGQAIDPISLREAQQTTLQAPLRQGTLGFGIQSMVQNQPLLRAIFTYVRTPINILRYGIRMTPGLQYAQQEFREMLSSPQPMVRAQARGQQMLGALWLAATAPFVINGQVTGGGPSDPKLRAELTAQGWRPYSLIYEGEDGKKSYLPLGRLDPPALAIGMMADLWDMHQHPELSGIKPAESGFEALAAGMQAVAISLVKNVLNKTYLMQLDNTLRALREPDKQMGRFVGNIAANLIPGSSAFRGFNPDEFSREARSLLDNIKDDFPGFSETLEPRYDSLGDPIRVQRGLWADEMNPGDKVRGELQRLILETGKSLTPAAPMRDSQVDLRDFKLSDGRSAYSRLNEYISKPKSGKPLVEALDSLMATPAYKKAPDGDGEAKGTKLWLINSIVQKYRQAAWLKVQAENPELLEAVQADRRKAAAAYSQEKPVDKTLNALGVK